MLRGNARERARATQWAREEICAKQGSAGAVWRALDDGFRVWVRDPASAAREIMLQFSNGDFRRRRACVVGRIDLAWGRTAR